MLSFQHLEPVMHAHQRTNLTQWLKTIRRLTKILIITLLQLSIDESHNAAFKVASTGPATKFATRQFPSATSSVVI